jgi:hypothetical protein
MALVLLALVLLVAAYPVGSFVWDQIDSDESRPAAVESPVRLRIVSPQANQVVSSPFTLEVESEGVPIAAAGEQADGLHYHAFVNVHPFTPGGQIIPHEEGVHHFAEGSLELDLPPGLHRIIVVFGDNDHRRPTDAPAAEVFFEVTG